MSEQESNVCAICGGVKRIDWTISFEECHPVEVRFDPASLAGNWRLCPGHPEPAPKHDGKLDEQGNATVWHDNIDVNVRGVLIDDSRRVCAYLTPTQALSMLAWLQQEEPTLKRLAKEQGGE